MYSVVVLGGGILMELRNIVLIDLMMAVIILTGMGCKGCWIKCVKKCSANIVLTGHEKNGLAFFANLTCLLAKNALFLQSF